MTTDTYDVTNPEKPTIEKDPVAILDYTFDWTLWLADIADTIVGAPVITITPSGALALSSQSNTAQKVTAWLSGGVTGKKYQVDCKIVTASVPPRTDSRSIFVKIKDR